MDIKVNDTVIVIAGKYKDKQGKVLKTYPDTHRVIVEGVGIVHKHEKARKANEPSRIVEEDAPIDVSNVMLVCEKCGKPTRVYHAFVDGKKVRVHGGAKGCGAVLDKAYVKKSKKTEEAPAEAPKKRTRKRSQKTEETAAKE